MRRTVIRTFKPERVSMTVHQHFYNWIEHERKEYEKKYGIPISQFKISKMIAERNNNLNNVGGLIREEIMRKKGRRF